MTRSDLKLRAAIGETSPVALKDTLCGMFEKTRRRLD